MVCIQIEAINSVGSLSNDDFPVDLGLSTTLVLVRS